MYTYLLQNQTDTWTGCMMTNVHTMSIGTNAGSVAEVGFISSTNQCYLPVSAAEREYTYIGYDGEGIMWALDSRIDAAYKFSVINGRLSLTNSTLKMWRDPSDGGSTFSIGGNGHTGEVKLVNSSLISSGSGCDIKLGINPGAGRLLAYDSTMGSPAVPLRGLYMSRNGELCTGWFDHSTVTVLNCSIGGRYNLGSGKADCTFLNGSLLSTATSLYIGNGYWAGTVTQTSTLTIVESQLKTAGSTFIGYSDFSGYPGFGRLSLSNNAVGLMKGNVSLGVESGSRGHLDVRAGSQLNVTNAAGTCQLIVGQTGYGTLWIDGGSTCRVDRLYVKNGVKSVLALNSGTLSVNTGVISNDVPLVIGDGTNPTTFKQWGGGVTSVHNDMAFAANSTWSIDADAITGAVLDVSGTLSFASGVMLSLSTTNSTYRFLDGQIIGYADSVTTTPQVLEDSELQVKLESVDARKALVLRYQGGTIILIR